MALDLEAIELIKQLKHRYFRAIDTADMPLVEDCFVDDASIHYIGGSYDIAMEGRDKILEFIAASFHADAAAMHTGHHPEITVEGDRATGKWYLNDVFYDLNYKVCTRGVAIYEDRYVKTGAGWKIQHSGYERVWEVVEKFGDEVKFTKRLLAETGRKKEV